MNDTKTIPEIIIIFIITVLFIIGLGLTASPVSDSISYL